MEQEQTNVNENQVVTTENQENVPAAAAESSDNFQVTFDFLKTPITQIADYIIISASKHNTSDIHFDPRENGMMVRFRIDGDLQDYSYIPKAYERNLTTRLKLLANMNITESRLPQDGAIKGMFGDTYLDMRVSCLPLNEGEKIVIRILDYTRSLQGIDSLGFHPDNLVKLKRMMAAPNGIILTTGATGSGKSTTTYSILQGLNTPETNIITVEDPIEMNIQGINQVQVNSEIGMTFAAALRSILRQDPNVILIGEIRDSETAQIAVRAAITGHLVLSTIHTNNSLSTIERLMDMDVERYLLSTALVGIISQRLAKGICPKCRFQRKTTPYEQKIFRNFLRLDVKTIWDANPKGCPNCRRGYKGRIAIQEVLELDDDIRTAISNPKLSKDELRAMVYTDKTITMLQDGLIKCINGETNFEEVYRVIEMENDDEEDYQSELTAVIDEATIENPVGINGADILDTLQQATSETIKEQLEANNAQIVSSDQSELGNVVDNLQQPEETPQEEVQPEVQEEVPETMEPTDQYTTNPEAERQNELPEIVQALPTEQQPEPEPEPTPEPEPVPDQPPMRATTAIENTNEENPLDVAIVDQPQPDNNTITTAIENVEPNTPLEVSIVEAKEEPLSEEVVEVPQAEDTYVPVDIPEVELPPYVEPVIEPITEETPEEQVEEQETEEPVIEEEVQEEIQEEIPIEEEVTEEENTEEAPLSDEIIEIPTFDNVEENTEPVTEEVVEEPVMEETITKEDVQSELEDMFNGNVLVNDEGVEQQEEEYNIFDFRNNQNMQFDENYEPIVRRNEEIQIVPDEEEAKEVFEEKVDSPNPDYDINSEVVGIKEEDNDDDEITRTIEYGDNIVEINDTSYELSDEEKIEEEEQQELEEDKENATEDDEYIDLNEEYNPDMLTQEDEKETPKEVNLEDDIIIDTDIEDIPDSDTREAIGSDFVDTDGPLLEEIPRLGTETEDLDEFNEIENYEESDEDPFEDTLEFDPEAFEEK